MAGLDFDKMDDLELFVRHFRHRLAHYSSVGDGKLSAYDACECVDIAWAEVSTRRERRAGAPDIVGTLRWEPAPGRGMTGVKEHADVTEGDWRGRFLVRRGVPGRFELLHNGNDCGCVFRTMDEAKAEAQARATPPKAGAL